MCRPEALAFGKAVGNLAAGMQQGADIAYQNRLNLYKHHQTVQASKESFVSSMGAKGAELMQMSEAAGQELSQLRSQAREAAACFPSIDAVLFVALLIFAKCFS